MTFLRLRSYTLLICLFSLGLEGWAATLPNAGPCPSVPPVAAEIEAGNYAQASRVLKEALARNPKDAQASLWLARIRLELGQYAQAIPLAERAVALAPGCSETHRVLGRSYGLNAEKIRSLWLARKSREEFQSAVKLDSSSISARRDLMEYYLEAPWFLGGSKARAWGQAQAIASIDPTEGLLARAAYWQETDNAVRAAEAYRHILESKPDRVDAYFEAAEFYESNGKAEQLQAAVQAASSAGPGDPRLTYYRGVARVMEGRELPEAEHDLKSYLAQAPQRSDFPSYASAHDWLGAIYERLGKTQEAIRQYQTALHLNPENHEAQAALHRLK